jgi:NTP pyrophosphatase (non-canonical NTP hydrolase)
MDQGNTGFSGEQEMTTKQKQILQKIIDHYGMRNQQLKCIEEMSELTKELAKELIGKGDEQRIIEEIADVLITVNQVMMMHSPELVRKMISTKLYRTLFRMEQEDEKENT